MKRDEFRDLTLCMKMFEYVAMRRPVISSWTRSVEAYYDQSSFLFFESNDAEGLAEAIRTLWAAPALSDQLVSRAASLTAPYR
jgi:hypothetical protein